MTVNASQTFRLQAAATGNGNGTPAAVDSFACAQQVEIAETGGGTCTVTVQGTFDGTNYYNVGYQQVDNTASPTRTVGAISVGASTRHVYQLLDPYQQVRAVIAAVAGGAIVTVNLYAIATY